MGLAKNDRVFLNSLRMEKVWGTRHIFAELSHNGWKKFQQSYIMRKVDTPCGAARFQVSARGRPSGPIGTALNIFSTAGREFRDHVPCSPPLLHRDTL